MCFFVSEFLTYRLYFWDSLMSLHKLGFCSILGFLLFLFWFLGIIPLYECIIICLSIRIDEHLDCFETLAIRHKAAINILIQVLLYMLSINSLGIEFLSLRVNIPIHFIRDWQFYHFCSLLQKVLEFQLFYMGHLHLVLLFYFMLALVVGMR